MKQKIVVVTGLDGSGKSTFIRKAEQLSDSEKISILKLPHTAKLSFPEDRDTEKICLDLFELSKTADELSSAALKAVALVGSMMMYERLLLHHAEPQVDLILCERHPLIDTGVYAPFYAPLTNPAGIDELYGILADSFFGESLKEAYRPAKINYKNNQGVFMNIIGFLYDFFYIKKKQSLKDMQELFGSQLPDEVIYLSAPPEILMQRISERKTKEAHESAEVLKTLGDAYENLFAQNYFKKQCKLHRVEDLQEENYLQVFNKIMDAG